MRIVVLLCCAIVAVVGAMPARAVSTNVIAGPVSSESPFFTTPTVVVEAGDRPVLLNQDIGLHGLESNNVGSDAAAWCGPVDPSFPEGPSNPRRYQLGDCPLFFADYASTLGGQAPIQGIEALIPGNTYAFVCTVTPGMRGILIAR